VRSDQGTAMDDLRGDDIAPEAIDVAFELAEFVDEIVEDGGAGPDDPAAGPHAAQPNYVELTVIAQDPQVKRTDAPDARHTILTAKVRVAADRLEPPLRSHRFHVLSYDPLTGNPAKDFDLLRDGVLRDRFANAADATLLRSHDFHAQNTYAIAARTLVAFESALGRRVPWASSGHQLYLVPHGELVANAHYSPENEALVFGYVPRKGEDTVYACLSHDIIAHETTHAILAGLRPDYFKPSLPDQMAFHEGFADIVALLSVFAIDEVVGAAFERTNPDDLVSRSQVTRAKLRRSFLLQIGEQFGKLVYGRPGRALRQSLELPTGSAWRDDPQFHEPHNRGEIIVAAVGSALVEMWFRRLELLLKPGMASRQLVAEEGSKAAQHLLQMAIRAIDYCPPIEFEFEDFLDALLTADRQVAPDDEREYRQTISEAFGRYDIGLPPQRIIDVNRLPRRPRYERFNFAALRNDPDEVFRFIWENDALLGISLDFHTRVTSLRPSVRVGPDGFVVSETVVTYTQQVEGSVADLVALSARQRHPFAPADQVLSPPAGMDSRTEVRMFGGGTIIFDQFGRPKYHQHKPLLDWDRQSRRLRYLFERGQTDSLERFGFSPRTPAREPFAALHRPDANEAERW
jgi:hypothetical protein